MDKTLEPQHKAGEMGRVAMDIHNLLVDARTRGVTRAECVAALHLCQITWAEHYLQAVIEKHAAESTGC